MCDERRVMSDEITQRRSRSAPNPRLVDVLTPFMFEEGGGGFFGGGLPRFQFLELWKSWTAGKSTDKSDCSWKSQPVAANNSIYFARERKRIEKIQKLKWMNMVIQTPPYF